MAISLRNSRHSKLRTLAVQWLRKHKPIVYRMLKRKAAETATVSDVNSNGGR